MKTTSAKLFKPLLLFLFIIFVSSHAQAGTIKTVKIGDHLAQEGVILIRPSDNADLAEVGQSLEKLGLTVIRASNFRGERRAFELVAQDKSFVSSYLLVRTKPGIDPQAAAKAAANLPEILAASPNYVHRPLFVPDDPFYSGDQQNFRQIGIERVWNVPPEGNVVVGVIDTGYRSQGMEDAAPNVLPGKDFESDDDDPTDYIGHGTIVSNVIAEETDNGLGCAGLASWVSILPLKVFPDDNDEALESDIIDALYYAADQGVDIVNMSLGGGDYNELFLGALEDAYNAGVFLVAATGNDGENELAYPSGYDVVFSVGSCRRHEYGSYPKKSGFSNYGEGLDLVAPGEDIIQEGYTPDNGVAYYKSIGTSVAAPHVSAVVAWMISLGGPGAPEDIALALRETAKKESEGWGDKLGYGELSASGAISEYAGTLPNDPPKAVASTIPETGVAPLQVSFSATASSDPDGNIISYDWHLSDDAYLFGSLVSRTFDTPGEYEAVLTITDEEGLSDSATVEFSVSAKPDDGRQEEEDDGCGCSVSSADKPDVASVISFFGIALLIMVRSFRKRKKMQLFPNEN